VARLQESPFRQDLRQRLEQGNAWRILIIKVFICLSVYMSTSLFCLSGIASRARRAVPNFLLTKFNCTTFETDPFLQCTNEGYCHNNPEIRARVACGPLVRCLEGGSFEVFVFRATSTTNHSRKKLITRHCTLDDLPWNDSGGSAYGVSALNTRSAQQGPTRKGSHMAVGAWPR
jgi:hypothetical protein